MENESERIKDFEASILKELKELYRYNTKIKVTVTEKFYRYKEYILGSITVDSRTVYTSDFIRNKTLTNALQSIRIKNDKIQFEIVSRLP